MPLRYISLFSGIEAASAAWMPLGWECVALSEIDPYCNEVLKARVPGAPNVGDIRDVDWSEYEGKADVVIGGSPCQSFSIAGKRTGLKGESGLILDYIRAVQGIRPRVFVWENVPGALSSEGGEAFRCLLGAMDEIGYGMAWRVLDAQFFHLAQRRERVFLVGVLGDAARAAEVLLEPESLRWDTSPSKRKRQELAAAARCRPSLCRTMLVRCGKPGGGKGALIQKDVASTLSTSNEQTLFQPECEGCLTPWDAQTSRVFSEEGPFATLQAGAKAGMNRQAVLAPCFGIVGNVIGRQPVNGGNGIGWCDPAAEGMYTLTATDRHAVAFMQNTRDEVRLVGGEGDVAGALAANAGAKQQNYLLARCAVCQYGDASGALTARADSSPCADRGPSVVAYKQNASEEARPVGGDGDIAGALVSGSRTRQTILCVESDQSNATPREELCGCLTARCAKGSPFLCMAEVSSNFKAESNSETDAHCVLSNGADAVGALCARDFKGIGSQYVNEGKVIGQDSSCGYVVRRLTPLECERLQGFPDRWTAIEYRGKSASDTQRYKALGNSMAVPVIRWIGERIERALSEEAEVS